MPVAPTDFLQVANDLKAGKKIDPKEPVDRTIVGRAYYAAFLAAREAVRSAYGKPYYQPKHKALTDGLAGASDVDVAELGARLQTLKSLRQRADYDTHLTVTSLEAGLMCVNAAAIIRDAPKLVSRIPPGI
jgi:uncharacterized protein (UPF0332 family)